MNTKLAACALLAALLAACAYAHEKCNYCQSRVSSTAAAHLMGEEVKPCEGSYPDLCEKILSAKRDVLAAMVLLQGPQCTCHKMFDVCDDNGCASQVMAGANQTDGIKCDLCKIVVSTARNALTAQYTVEAIEQAVHNVCNKAAGFKDVCDIILQTGVKTLIEYIRSYTDNNVVCAKIRLC